MKYPSGVVVGWLVDAGWPPGAIDEAVARAWAASRLEASLVTPWPPTTWDRSVGLWQVQTAGLDDDVAWALTGGQAAAQDALERWRAAGGAWGWCGCADGPALAEGRAMFAGARNASRLAQVTSGPPADWRGYAEHQAGTRPAQAAFRAIAGTPDMRGRV